MLLPFLQRLAMVDSRRRFPVEWLVTLPSDRPLNSPQTHFYDLCKFVYTNPGISGAEFSNKINSILLEGFGLLQMLINEKHVPSSKHIELHVNLSFQLQMIGGHYGINRFIKNHIESIANGNQKDISLLTSHIIKCGAVQPAIQYAQALLLDICHSIGGDGGSRLGGNISNSRTPRCHEVWTRNLRELSEALCAHVALQDSRRLALAMALHARLGDRSPLAALGEDLVDVVAPRDPPRYITWHDVCASLRAGGGGGGGGSFGVGRR
jgi:hypothetical protein